MSRPTSRRAALLQVAADAELSALTAGATVAGGGVQPHIEAALLAARRRR